MIFFLSVRSKATLRISCSWEIPVIAFLNVKSTIESPAVYNKDKNSWIMKLLNWNKFLRNVVFLHIRDQSPSVVERLFTCGFVNLFPLLYFSNLNKRLSKIIIKFYEPGHALWSAVSVFFIITWKIKMLDSLKCHFDSFLCSA